MSASRYFDLSIRLENAQMQTDGEIATALREVADLLAEGGDGNRSNPTMGLERVADVNGQRVGWWKIGDSRRSEETYR